MQSLIFPDEYVAAAKEIMDPITMALTNKTREALERGETPPLLGALTAADLARWIENARAKKQKNRRKNNVRHV